jgi:hypothetical protein
MRNERNRFFVKLFAIAFLFCFVCSDQQGCQMAYFQTKKTVWVNFGGPWKEKVGIYYGHLKYILQTICIFHGTLVI